MTVVIDGKSLSEDQVIRVARDREDCRLDESAILRMDRARRIVERNLASREKVYGLTTGVGVLKLVSRPDDEDSGAFERRLLEFHRVAQGPSYEPDVVRAAALRLLNHFALGTVGVRSAFAVRLASGLNTSPDPVVPKLGQNLVVMPAIVLGYIGDFVLAAGEGLACLGNDALVNGHTALALHDLASLSRAMEAAAALSLEAFGSKLSAIDERAMALRGRPGGVRAASGMRSLLRGSYLWDYSQARNLQDPITFRCAAHLLGGFYEAMTYATNMLGSELNCSQGNPVVLIDSEEVVHIGNWDASAIMASLDFLRVALATPLTASGERTIKLLDHAWSGLPTGLAMTAVPGDSGLAMYQILVRAIVSEARLLAQPVSLELASTSQAEGIEDREACELLSCRNLAAMIELAEQIVAVELFVSSYASAARARHPAGLGTAELGRRIRSLIPWDANGLSIPIDVSPLVAAIRARELTRDLPN